MRARAALGFPVRAIVRLASRDPSARGLVDVVVATRDARRRPDARRALGAADATRASRPSSLARRCSGRAYAARRRASRSHVADAARPSRHPRSLRRLGAARDHGRCRRRSTCRGAASPRADSVAGALGDRSTPASASRRETGFSGDGGGVRVDRRICGTGAGTRLAVIDDDAADVEQLELDRGRAASASSGAPATERPRRPDGRLGRGRRRPRRNALRGRGARCVGAALLHPEAGRRRRLAAARHRARRSSTEPTSSCARRTSRAPRARCSTTPWRSPRTSGAGARHRRRAAHRPRDIERRAHRCTRACRSGFGDPASDPRVHCVAPGGRHGRVVSVADARGKAAAIRQPRARGALAGPGRRPRVPVLVPRAAVSRRVERRLRHRGRRRAAASSARNPSSSCTSCTRCSREAWTRPSRARLAAAALADPADVLPSGEIATGTTPSAATAGSTRRARAHRRGSRGPGARGDGRGTRSRSRWCAASPATLFGRPRALGGPRAAGAAGRRARRAGAPPARALDRRETVARRRRTRPEPWRGSSGPGRANSAHPAAPVVGGARRARPRLRRLGRRDPRDATSSAALALFAELDGRACRSPTCRARFHRERPGLSSGSGALARPEPMAHPRLKKFTRASARSRRSRCASRRSRFSNAANWYAAPVSRGPRHRRRQRLQHRDAHVERHRAGAALSRITRVDRWSRRRTDAHGEYAARAWDRAVDDAAHAGHRSVHVRVATANGERELDLRARAARRDELVALRRDADLRRRALRARRDHGAQSRAPRAARAHVREVRALRVAASSSRSSTPTPRAHGAALSRRVRLRSVRADGARAAAAGRHPAHRGAIRWLLRVLDAPASRSPRRRSRATRSARRYRAAERFARSSSCGAMFSSSRVLGVRYGARRGTRRETLRVLFRATATP